MDEPVDMKIDKAHYLNKRYCIDSLNLDKTIVDFKIKKFDLENGTAEKTITNLFEKADNRDFDNVFCRVACIDLIYSTQVQRFSDNGIVAVTKHIKNLASEIEEVVKRNKLDFDLYNKLVKVKFSHINSETKETEDKTRRLYSFASKFLSFSMPNVYPIFDRRVRTILGLPDSVSYEEYSKLIISIQKNYRDSGIDKTVKEWDMFLWQWEKDLEEELKEK